MWLLLAISCSSHRYRLEPLEWAPAELQSSMDPQFGSGALPEWDQCGFVTAGTAMLDGVYVARPSQAGLEWLHVPRLKAYGRLVAVVNSEGGALVVEGFEGEQVPPLAVSLICRHGRAVGLRAQITSATGVTSAMRLQSTVFDWKEGRGAIQRRRRLGVTLRFGDGAETVLEPAQYWWESQEGTPVVLVNGESVALLWTSYGSGSVRGIVLPEQNPIAIPVLAWAAVPIAGHPSEALMLSEGGVLESMSLQPSGALSRGESLDVGYLWSGATERTRDPGGDGGPMPPSHGANNLFLPGARAFQAGGNTWLVAAQVTLFSVGCVPSGAGLGGPVVELAVTSAPTVRTVGGDLLVGDGALVRRFACAQGQGIREVTME